MVSIRYLFIFLVLVLPLFSFSQIEDARLWLRLGIEKKINRKLSLSAEFTNRNDNNLERFQTYALEIGPQYELKKWLVLGVFYRYSGKREDIPYYAQRHRISFEVTFKKKFYSIFKVSQQFKFQNQYKSILTSEDGLSGSYNLRSSSEVAFDLNRKFEPYIGTEIFYNLEYDNNGFTRVRYTAGIGYKIDKHNRIKLFFTHQREINESDPTYSYVYGLTYRFVF